MKLSDTSNAFFKGFKIKLKPSKNQIKIFEKYFGMTRYFYNLALERIGIAYNDYRNGNRSRWSVTKFELSNYLSEIRSMPGNEWMKDYDLASERCAMFSAIDAVERFEKMRSNPSAYYKQKRDKCSSAFIRSDRVRIYDDKVAVPSIGFVNSDHHDYEKRPIRRRGQRLPYGSMMIVFDGIDYWLSGLERHSLAKPQRDDTASTDPVGIDINMSKSDWIVDSTGISVTMPDVTRVDDKIHELQRKLDHKQYVNNLRSFKDENQVLIKSGKLTSQRRRTKREEKLRNKLKKAYRHRSNMFKDRILKYSKSLVDRNPSAVVIEDLSCLALVERHKQEQRADHSFNFRIFDMRAWEIKKTITNRCTEARIPLIQASRTYPSTQLCSCCGHRFTGENKLKLSDRVYKCPECGSKIDRDLNSSYNLKYLGWSYLGDSNFPESHNEYKDDYDVLLD